MYLVQPGVVVRLTHTDVQVRTGALTVPEAAHDPLTLLRTHAHLHSLTQRQHGLGQRVTDTHKHTHVRLDWGIMGLNTFRRPNTHSSV